MKLILTMNLIPYNESEIRDKYKATRKKEESLLQKQMGYQRLIST